MLKYLFVINALVAFNILPNSVVICTEYFCEANNDGNLTWPETQPEATIPSQEFCFKPDGHLLTRTCSNETGAPQWSTINDKCDYIPGNSPATQELIKHYKVIDPLDSEVATPLAAIDFDEMTNVVAENYTVFNSFDIYLIACVVSRTDCVKLEQFTNIYESLLKIDNTVLQESQTKMRATDMLLSSDVFTSKCYSQWNTDIENSNFAVKSLADPHTGIIIKTNDNERSISFLNNDFSIDDILNIQETETVFWVNPFSSDVMITFFSNQNFFNENSSSVIKNATYVFGMFGTSSDATAWLIKPLNNYTSTKNTKCAYWNLEDERGSWLKYGEFQIVQSYFVCKIQLTNIYMAIILTPENDPSDDLFDIMGNSHTSSELLSRLYQVLLRFDKNEDELVFTTGDIFLIEGILKKAANSTVNDNDLELLSQVLSYLQLIDANVLSNSQETDTSTDFILYYTDTILLNHVYQSDLEISTENFITFVYTQNYTDFSGVVLLKNSTVDILEGPVNASDLLKYENLDSALILSPELKTQMGRETKIIINIFLTDVLFNEQKKSFNYTSVEKVFNVLIPDLLENYTGPISIFHNVTSSGQKCSYWSYNPPEHIAGSWKNDSSGTNLYSLIQCDYWHTTHFGLLLFEAGKYEDTEALDIVTTIGCSLSLFGYLGIILTAFVFREWRSQVSNKVLLSFVISGLVQLVVFYISSNVKDYGENYGLCVFTGIVLHYSVLVQFAWMLIIALFQYRKVVLHQNDQITRLLLKSNLFAWGCPLVPVICVIAANSENYYNSNSKICYPSGYALYFGVWWPISVVIVINLLIFLLVVDGILNKKSQSRSHGSENSLQQFRRIMFIFFLFGFTWVFGFLAEMAYSIVFVYLFDILATLQGIVLFFAYIVLDKNVKEMYRQKITKKPNSKNATKSVRHVTGSYNVK